MAIINWESPEGDLGTFTTSQVLSLQLWAYSDDPTSVIKFKLLSGNFPTGIITDPVQISSDGIITGTLDDVTTQTVSSFTIRAYDQYGTLRDRTFSMTVVNYTVPSFVQSTGELLSTTDSVYISYQVQYVNPIESETISIILTSGSLPTGLTINSTGLITGYAAPPTTVTGIPITKTYQFTLEISSRLGKSTGAYSIVVANHQLNHGSNTRIPVILNSKPRFNPIPDSDEYYDYYIGSDNEIPTASANDYFSFKVIGYDFDDNNISYSFSGLPSGLSGDTVTGWITGTLSMAVVGINRYIFNVNVYKTDYPAVVSETITFGLTVSNQLVNDIVWVTGSDLGTINNGAISELSVSATSSRGLVYSLVQGSLPPTLELLETGELAGRISFQPLGRLLNEGAQSEFKFTIVAYASQFPLLKKERQFTLKVNQKFPKPLENIYIKASPSVANRRILTDLLTDTSIIPTSYLYRPNDPFFGKATDVRFVHVYGVTPTTMTGYINAIQTNHYTRQVVLGNIKTAVARDKNGDIVYEVVYSEIIDNLITPQGVSVPEVIDWPVPINLPNNTTITEVRPGSLINMRKEVVSILGQNTDIDLLPRWMTSQQVDGNITGYVQGWVICYTLPNKSAIIKSNIENNWGNTLNSVEFLIDRYLIDKSATYDWNLDLSIPSWNELPSATPAPNSLDDYNISILFPQKTIIPT